MTNEELFFKYEKYIYKLLHKNSRWTYDYPLEDVYQQSKLKLWEVILKASSYAEMRKNRGENVASMSTFVYRCLENNLKHMRDSKRSLCDFVPEMDGIVDANIEEKVDARIFVEKLNSSDKQILEYKISKDEARRVSSPWRLKKYKGKINKYFT